MRFDENWRDAWDAQCGLLIFSGRDCLNCIELAAHLQDTQPTDLNLPNAMVTSWLERESSEAAAFRSLHPGIVAAIDVLPFAIFTSNGVPTTSVRAATVERLTAAANNL